MPLFGGHISIAGGVELAPERARALRFDAMQIFTKSQRQWAAKPLEQERAALFRANRAANGINVVASHLSYLINLASFERRKRKMSMDAFADDLRRCALLGIDQAIFHPGSHMGKGASRGIRRLAESLDQVLDEADPGGPRVLVEGTAGQGDQLGATFEELRDILAASRHPDRLGICLDTCHIFAAGYDVRTREAYEETIARFDAIVGLSRLEAWHVNDSKGPLGCRRDRHAHLGEGEIGTAPFRRLARDARFRELPLYLETPEGERHYAMNLAVLRGPSRRHAQRARTSDEPRVRRRAAPGG